MTKNDQAATDAGYYFDERYAQRVREFFRRYLRHSTGRWAGKPFELSDWQYDQVVKPLFSWVNATGKRRFRKAYLSTAKKNGKTTLIAGLLLYFLLADFEPGPEIYSAAADKDQAAIMYREAMKMVMASPELSATVMIKESTKTLVGPDAAKYRALSADAHRQDGLNASVVLIDELHCQQNRELWDKLRYAGTSREQPLLLSITTAGGDMETICGEQYTYAKQVLADETIDYTFFAYIAEAGPDDDWSDEETWKKANPGYGITMDPADFRADYLEAKESPAKENAFRRYRCNQWVQTAAAWLSMDQWHNNRDDFSLDDVKGRKAYGGLDLSATDDTTALVIIIPTDTGIRIVPHFWLPEKNIGFLERKHRVAYRAWAKQGLITLTPGNVVDYPTIRTAVNKVADEYDLQGLAIDRKFQGQQLESELVDDGLTVYPAGQGWMSQDPPCKELERLIKAHRAWHRGHALLTWHASNAVVDIDKNGNYSLNKRKSRSKIDGIAALVNGIGLWLRLGHGPSMYNEQGVEFI